MMKLDVIYIYMYTRAKLCTALVVLLTQTKEFKVSTTMYSSFISKYEYSPLYYVSVNFVRSGHCCTTKESIFALESVNL